MRLRTYSPRLGVFLMTHVWWEQCHCELYRVVALAGLQPRQSDALPAAAAAGLGPPFVDHCRRQALAHARAMADMFSLLLTLDSGVPVTDLDLPVCLYQCARMLYCSFAVDGDGGAGCGMAVESVTELAGVCLRVLEQSICTPATLTIVSGQGTFWPVQDCTGADKTQRTELERLIAHGLSRAPPAPSPSATIDDRAGGAEEFTAVLKNGSRSLDGRDSDPSIEDVVPAYDPLVGIVVAVDDSHHGALSPPPSA